MNIRITNSMMTNNTMRDLNYNKGMMEKYGRQMSSFQRINNLGDDPAGLVVAMQCKMSRARNDNYLAGIRDVKSLVDSTEDAILSVNEIIKRVGELVIDASTDGKTSEDRQKIAAEVKQWREQLLDLANTKINGEYIFAGYNTTKKPFGSTEVTETYTVDGNPVTRTRTVMTYNGEIMDDAYKGTTKYLEELAQHVTYEVGPDGTFFDTGFNGIQLMGTGNDNLFNLLSKLYDTLTYEDTSGTETVGSKAPDVIPENGTPSLANPDGIHFVDAFQRMQKKMMVMEADIGGRSNRLELMQSRYEQQNLTYKEQESMIIDVDVSEAVTNFKMMEAMYNAALQSTANIIQPSLMDYLR